MSVSGALSAAVSGLQVQGRSLGSISDNIANFNTSGYKRVETRFSTLVTVSNAQVHQPGGVRSIPFRTNNIQGSVTSTGVQTNLAVAGSGYFSVSKVETIIGGLPSFEPDSLFTRAGDFSVDKLGYLVNSAGYYLNAWKVQDGQNMVVDRTKAEPIRIEQLRDSPKATTLVEYAANLPAKVRESLDVNKDTDDIELQPTQVLFYDALGNEHLMSVQWTKDTTPFPNTTDRPPENTWYVKFSAPNISFKPNTNAKNNALTVDSVTYKVTFFGEHELPNLAGGIKSVSQLYTNPTVPAQNLDAQAAAIDALKDVERRAPIAGAIVTDDGGTPPTKYSVKTVTVDKSPVNFDAGDFLADASIDASGKVKMKLDDIEYEGYLLFNGTTKEVKAKQTLVLTDNPSGGGNTFSIELDMSASGSNKTYDFAVAGDPAALLADLQAATAGLERAWPYRNAVGPALQKFTVIGDPGNFDGADFASLKIGENGEALVVVGGVTYTGKVRVNERGIITGDLVLTNPNARHNGFRISFTKAWDLDGGGGEEILSSAPGTPAQLKLPLVYAPVSTNYQTASPKPVMQDVNFDFGNYGLADRLTQFAGDDIDGVNTRQDGVPPGSFRDLSIDELGFVTLNYDNGQRRTYFQIPIAQFNNPNALQLLQGNSFGATFDSGAASYSNPGGNGAGTVVASSLEGSNVDIADEFSKMIVTQRAYSANARIVTTADQMLEEVVNIVR